MVAVPLPAFEPDKSKFNAGALPSAVNAVPAIDGWGPLKAPVTIDAVYDYLTDEDGNRLTDEDGNLLVTGVGGAPILGEIGMPGTVKGAIAARDSEATEHLFAGNVTSLFKFDFTTYVWADVSRASGGDYATGGRWSSAQFADSVYFANGVDAEQVFELTAGTVFTPNTTAPIAKYIRQVGDFMVRGNIVDHPNRVQWSDFNRPDVNDDASQASFSGYQDCPEGEEVMGIVPVTGGFHAWMRKALQLFSINLVNGSYPITRTAGDTARGTNAPYSIGIIGQDDYVIYLSDGFWRFKGSMISIGLGKVNKWFLTECDQNELENIVANVDPENNVVWWSYTDNSAVRKLLGYHYLLDQFCIAEIPLQTSMQARSFAYSVDGVPVLDDNLMRFAAINADGRLVYLAGDNLAATFITNEVKLSAYRFFMNRAWLQGDAASYTITVQTKDTPAGSFRTRSAASPSTRTGQAALRADGLFHKLTATIAAADPWTTATAIEVEGTGSGK